MKPLTEAELSLVFDATQDVIHSLGLALTELQTVAQSLQTTTVPPSEAES